MRSGVSYAGATVIASGSNTITQNTPTNFQVTGLTAATNYDLYAAAEDVIGLNGYPPVKRQFTTLPNTYADHGVGEPGGARHRELRRPGQRRQQQYLHGRGQPRLCAGQLERRLFRPPDLC